MDAPPAVEDLVLRPDGIGDLVIGTAEGIGDEPDDMIRFEDDYCVGTRGEGFPPAGSPEADAWVLVDEYRVGETFAFGSAVVDGLLVAVQVGLSSAVRTEAGIGLASTRVEVLEAYPGASLVLAGPITDVYEVVGHGRLLIEVTRAGELIDATSGPGPDEVVALHAVAVDAEPFAVWGSDYVMFPCM